MPSVTKCGRRWALVLTACALLGEGVGTLTAQEPRPELSTGDSGDDIQALKRQFERQQQQVEQLQKRLAELRQGSEPAPADLPPPLPPDRGTVEQMVADYLRRQDEAKKQQAAADRAKAEEDGYKVGTDLRISARWNPLNGVTFETPNKDFVSHLGVWFQYDNVWWNQSASLKAPTQIGDLQDGTFFRRVRPTWDGTAWEVVEWNIILSLEQVNNGVMDLDEVWVGVTKLPVIGSVRVGKFRVPQGLESGAYSVAKTQTFLEQSAFTDAFYENLASGVWTGNSVLDQRLT